MSHLQAWRPAPRPGLVPLYPFGFGTALGRSFSALRGNPKVLLGFAVVIQAVAGLIGVAIVGLVAFWTFSRLETVDENSADFVAILAGSLAILAIATFGFSLLQSAVSVIVQGVVVAEVSRAVLGERATLRELWGVVRTRFWALAGYFLLQIAVITVVVAVAVVPFVLLAVGQQWVGLGIAALIAVLAIVPALVLAAWLGTKLYLVPAAIVLERQGPIGGIRRSWMLTRGRFWPTFGVLALLTLILGVASNLAAAPLQLFAGFIQPLLFPFGGPASPDGGAPVGAGMVLAVIGGVITTALTLLISAVSTIVIATGGALMYVDARMRHEGVDLRLQAYVEQRELGSSALPDPWAYDPSFGAYAATPRPGYTPGYLTPEQAAAQAQQAYAQQAYAQQQPYATPGYPAPPSAPSGQQTYAPQQPYAAQPYEQQPYAAQPYGQQPPYAPEPSASPQVPSAPPAPPSPQQWQPPAPPNGGA